MGSEYRCRFISYYNRNNVDCYREQRKKVADLEFGTPVYQDENGIWHESLSKEPETLAIVDEMTVESHPLTDMIEYCDKEMAKVLSDQTITDDHVDSIDALVERDEEGRTDAEKREDIRARMPKFVGIDIAHPIAYDTPNANYCDIPTLLPKKEVE